MAIKGSPNKNKKKSVKKVLPPLQYVDIEHIESLDHIQLQEHLEKSLPKKPVVVEEVIDIPVSKESNYMPQILGLAIFVLVLVIL